jgi:hypothetical protein
MTTSRKRGTGEKRLGSRRFSPFILNPPLSLPFFFPPFITNNNLVINFGCLLQHLRSSERNLQLLL